ncbi:MAG: ATP-binding cassette domain-containing protein [Actinobacteria bacterium]|nr:ATP-binding cassette domain-containing protein [Actinomycetota bacterium]
MVAVEARGLSKSFGDKRAVNNLSFTLEPGVVTGFLGPNGSGKSTTMRLMLGLDHGEGTTTWEGKRLSAHKHTTQVVGAHLDARFFNPNRTARAHLRMLGAESNVSNTRVDEVLDMVGLAAEAKKRPKTFSLGMGQRLGLAGAILAKPKTLLLDEPANGLDPQSIQWLRDFLKFYASDGNIVFVSSHLLTEMQQMAEHVVVISRGNLIADESAASFINRSTRNDVLVRTPNRAQLETALKAAGIQVKLDGEDGLAVAAHDTAAIGDVAFANQIVIHELTRRSASLEEAFLELTANQQDYATGGGTK